MASVSNGGPRYILNGIRDESVIAPIAVPETQPQNLPHIYIIAEKGPLEPMQLDPTLLTTYYGSKTFDQLSKYWTFGSAYLNIFTSAANNVVVQRVHPDDALKPALISIGIDVVQDVIPEYERDDDGFPIIDTDGDYITTGNTVTGYIGRLIVNRSTSHSVGQAIINQRGLLISSTGVQSTYYPLMDLEVAYPGAYGNNVGINLYAPTTKSEDQLNLTVATDQVAQLYRLAIFQREDINSTAIVQKTRADNAAYIDFSFKKSVVSTATTYKYDFDLRIKDWASAAEGMIPMPGILGKTHVYREQLNKVLKLIYTAEQPNNRYLIAAESNAEQQINIFGGEDFYGRKYFNFHLQTVAEGGANLNDTAIYYAEEGSDGDLEDVNKVYDDLCKVQFDNYGSLDGIEVLDDARYPMSTYWDCGYSIETKRSLISLLGKRKDIIVYYAPWFADGTILSSAEQRSLARALRTYAQLFPESTFSGTSVCRAIAFMQSGELAGEDSDVRYPHLLDFAYRKALYMGSGDGILKTANAYDAERNNQIKLLKNMDLLWEPQDIRNTAWDLGLNYAMWFDKTKAYIPHVQTIFNAESSVLRDEMSLSICVDIEKQCQKAYRQLPVDTRRTTAQTLSRLKAILQELTRDRYDGRVDITIDAFQTRMDANSRVRYSCEVKADFNKGMYIGSFTVVSRNRDDVVA